MDMKTLLRMASSGTGFFEPSGNASADLRDFQDLAALAFEAERLGYVYAVYVHRVPDPEGDVYNQIYVTGVTNLGLQFAGDS
ncbi:hypothetical protein [Noviluteimonas dokdonensis]|uniref:hypothetical protein n=1 Tax=Noviluteimonas dokdonensis TaxID=414050 RepID=UPI00126A2E4D|nr:hypothetical protein [Lysobacter dokdonensis]